MGSETSSHCVQLRAGNGKAAFDAGDVFTNPEAAAQVMIKYAHNALGPGRMFPQTGHLRENFRNKGPVGSQTGPPKPGGQLLHHCKLYLLLQTAGID